MIEMDGVNICDIICDRRDTCNLANSLRDQTDPEAGKTIANPRVGTLNRLVVDSAQLQPFRDCRRPGVYAQAITEVLGRRMTRAARTVRDQLLRRAGK